MDNIKKFEDFLDRMQGLLDDAKKQGHIIVRIDDLENAFPELKENKGSEDENIRKDIVAAVETYGDFTQGRKEEIYTWLENQDKHTTDKVEPKFKVGDWVVTDKDGIVQIGAVNKGYYTLNNGMDFSTSYVEKYWRLWTIEDAKEGDVLNSRGVPFIYKKHDKNYVYFYCGINCGINLVDGFIVDAWDDNFRVYPATKEQRELLFAKMKEAGYEWNAEKKELNNIENQGEQIHSNSEKVRMDEEPKWTEDDEETMLHCCGAVASTDSYKRDDKEKF